MKHKVMISKYIPGAGDEALAFLRRGDYFGEMVLLGAGLRSATATARSESVVVLALPSQPVLELVQDPSGASVELVKLLCGVGSKRLGEMAKRIVGWHALAGGDYF